MALAPPWLAGQRGGMGIVRPAWGAVAAAIHHHRSQSQDARAASVGFPRDPLEDDTVQGIVGGRGGSIELDGSRRKCLHCIGHGFKRKTRALEDIGELFHATDGV